MARFAEDRIELRRDVSWPDLERLLAAKVDHVSPRVHYLDGVLELVTPSRGHEKHGAWISALVTAYALERGIELSSYRSWLLQDKVRKAGAEPDDCFIVGDDSAKPLDRPHIAIEVQWSRRGVDKLEVYRRVGVGEVWFWETHTLAVYVRRRGRFVRSARSASLPGLDIEQLVAFIDRPTMTQAIRDYRAALAQY